MLTRSPDPGTVCPPSAVPVRLRLSQALISLTAPVEQLSDRRYKPAVVPCDSQVTNVCERTGARGARLKRAFRKVNFAVWDAIFCGTIFIWINLTFFFIQII